MSDENESVLLKLTRMEGKLDLSNLRHDQTEARLKIRWCREVAGYEIEELGR